MPRLDLSLLRMRRADLEAATRTHADPRVRHRAHLLLHLLRTGTMTATCAELGCGNRNLWTWRRRCELLGIEGLHDQPRSGKPRRMDATDDAFLAKTLDHASPMDYGYPVAVWSLADLAHLLAQHRQVVLGTQALSRHLARLGFVYRRPRLDLRHRQDADAIASYRHTLDQLQKKGVPLSAASSTWMKHTSRPTQDWQRRGAVADDHDGSPPPAPIAASPSSVRSTRQRDASRAC